MTQNPTKDTQAAVQAAEPVPRLGYTVAEVAASLGISKGKVFQLIRDGQIKRFRIGARVMVADAELRRFVQAQIDAENPQK